MARGGETTRDGAPRRATISIAGVFGLLVFVACLIGIYSRLPGTLAVFWLANALLLGLLIRSPPAATLATWVAAAAGYLVADLATGADLASAALLNAANLAGVVVGFYAFRRMPDVDRSLTRAVSVAYLAAMAGLAAAVAAVIGGVVNVVMFEGTWWSGWLDWFSSELVNYMVLLPPILTFPAASLARAVADRRLADLRSRLYRQLGRSIIPAAMLSLSLLLAWLIGGFGALAFTMPALVAAALLTNVFTTSVLVAGSTAWSLVLTVQGKAGLTNAVGIPVPSSTQIGLSLLAVGPLAVACTMAEQERSRLALGHATLDDLTGAYRRGEFVRRAEGAVAAASRAGQPSSMLMMDLDLFKRLNDNLGHQAGDRALIDFAENVQARLCPQDLFARLGGEEFAVLMPGVDRPEATVAAEAIRARQEEQARATFGDLGPTVSIGLSCANESGGGLSELLSSADAALYRAKIADRNRVVTDADR